MSDTVRDLLDAINAFEDEHGQDPGYRDVCHGLRDAELSLHRMEAHREGPPSAREGDDGESRPKDMKESFKDAHARAADQYAGHNEADRNDEGEGPNSRKRRRGAPAQKEDM